VSRTDIERHDGLRPPKGHFYSGDCVRFEKEWVLSECEKATHIVMAFQQDNAGKSCLMEAHTGDIKYVRL